MADLDAQGSSSIRPIPVEQSEQSVEPTQKEKSRLVLIILAIMLCGGLLAVVYVPQFMKDKEREDNQYNNFDFVYQEGAWYTVVNKGDQPFQVPFYYHPRDLEGIVVDATIRDRFFSVRDKQGQIYITLDPDGGDNKIVIAGVEIAKVTGTRYGLLGVETSSAFIKTPSSATANTPTPIKTCRDANETTLIVWLTLSDKNIATAEGNCIILEAKSFNETVMVADRLVYHLFGVMS